MNRSELRSLNVARLKLNFANNGIVKGKIRERYYREVYERLEEFLDNQAVQYIIVKEEKLK